MASHRLRVAQVLEATVGGTARHVLDLCEGLDRDAFELLVLWSPTRDAHPERSVARLKAAGAQVALVPMARGPSPVADMAALRTVRRALQGFAPDIVHAHSSKAGMLGRLAAAGGPTSPATVYTPHAFSFLMNVSPARRALYLAVERRLGRSTDRLVAVCESERQVALDADVIAPERCVVIRNGVPAPEPGAADRAAGPPVPGLPPAATVILCVGDLRPQKGHVYAAAAMRQVTRSLPAAHLVIAGEGPKRGAILHAAGEAIGHVHLLGHRDDIPRLLARCDVFCQPSLWEGCPYALLEAAAAGRALVGSDVPGVSDILQEGRCGWPVRPADAEALTLALCEALQDPAARAARGRAAAALVAEQYTLEGMVAQTAEFYAELGEARRGLSSGTHMGG